MIDFLTLSYRSFMYLVSFVLFSTQIKDEERTDATVSLSTLQTLSGYFLEFGCQTFYIRKISI